jgi:tetratricopeptide (TPR) repeat protein
MSENILVEQFKLLKRAKKLEQMGNVDRALDLYLELHERYEPNTSDAYERPAKLLERKKEYHKALEMCEKAITAIENDKMSGTKDKFQKRIDAINAKLKDEPAKIVEGSSSYVLNIVGFRSKTKGKMIVASIFYLLFIVLGFLLKSIYPTLLLVGLVHTLTYFVDVFQLKDKKFKIPLLIALILSLLITAMAAFNLPAAVNRIIEIQDSEGQLEGGSDLFTDQEEDLPKISSTHIQEAIDLITSEIEVDEATISVSGDSIIFGLLLQPSTSKKKATDLSENFIEILAHRVSQDEDISAPTFSSHGELYDFYNFIISAGSDSKTLLAKGKKNNTSKYITWID